MLPVQGNRDAVKAATALRDSPAAVERRGGGKAAKLVSVTRPHLNDFARGGLVSVQILSCNFCLLNRISTLEGSQLMTLLQQLCLMKERRMFGWLRIKQV